MENGSMWGPLATFFAVALYGGLHSVLASETVKDWAQRNFGGPARRGYRLFFNVVGVITFLPVVAIPAVLPGEHLYSIRPPWLWLTSALQLFAVGLVLVGLRQTGAAEFLGLAQLTGPTEPSELVTSGLYRWVRHPLYFAGLLFIWSVPVMTTSLLALNLGLTGYLYIGSIFEERKLRAELGEAYDDYRRQVPRLIPLPGKHYRGSTGGDRARGNDGA